MTTPQNAILDGQDSRFFYFLEYQLLGSTSEQQIIKTLKSIGHAQGVYQLVAFGPDLAQRLLPETEALAFAPMKTLAGPDYQMPDTQSDLFFWLHGANNSDLYDQVLTIQNSMSGLAKLTQDQAGFTYHDNKDLIGFEDGTANPKEDARIPVALIQDDAANKDGAIVFAQKWRHKLEQFLSLPVAAQEKIVGRTKVENIELEGNDMPDDSHVSRTDVKLDGEAMKIYRRSAPYGNATEKGLMFLCFACSQKRIQIQLERMVGCTGDGLSDHLMKYSDAVSGSYFYAPSQTQLDKLLG
ncbi:Dyp-type peroxidase [Litoribrevibacter euphylliae]|uniref:Dyp-type peroxidase n=1 Tax=Litoribrevibacter euphylliae TaxID=1834034 RepID=A0ABV7HG10_9GAMM